MTTKISYKTRKKKRKIWKRKKDERVVTYLCPFIFVLGLNFIWNFKGREYDENLEKSIGRKWGKWLGMRNKCHFEEIKNCNIVQKEFSLKNNNNNKKSFFQF